MARRDLASGLWNLGYYWSSVGILNIETSHLTNIVKFSLTLLVQSHENNYS